MNFNWNATFKIQDILGLMLMLVLRNDIRMLVKKILNTSSIPKYLNTKYLYQIL